MEIDYSVEIWWKSNSVEIWWKWTKRWKSVEINYLVEID